ncbi:MAG TPA: HutD family protein [Burkholderiales bacterium]|nr:HutD family protein [Burkholderiales bacterium]
MKLLRRASYRAIPWRNGRGMTHRIASSPRDAGYDDLDWQVTRPEISADCPFSNLPGLDRQFLLVEGGGLTIRIRCPREGIAFERRIDAPLQPFAFRGDWEVDCALHDGPVHALNVMTRRGRVGARLEIIEPGAAQRVAKPAGESLLAYVARGPVDACRTWGKATLAADDSILVDEEGAAEIAIAPAASRGARLVLVRLHARDALR